MKVSQKGTGKKIDRLMNKRLLIILLYTTSLDFIDFVYTPKLSKELFMLIY